MTSHPFNYDVTYRVITAVWCTAHFALITEHTDVFTVHKHITFQGGPEVVAMFYFR